MYFMAFNQMTCDSYIAEGVPMTVANVFVLQGCCGSTGSSTSQPGIFMRLILNVDFYFIIFNRDICFNAQFFSIEIFQKLDRNVKDILEYPRKYFCDFTGLLVFFSITCEHCFEVVRRYLQFVPLAVTTITTKTAVLISAIALQMIRKKVRWKKVSILHMYLKSC